MLGAATLLAIHAALTNVDVPGLMEKVHAELEEARKREVRTGEGRDVERGEPVDGDAGTTDEV